MRRHGPERVAPRRAARRLTQRPSRPKDGLLSWVSETIGPVPLSLTWEDDEQVRGGCVERAFSVRDHRGSVPAVFWRPAASEPLRPALMLLGHGGSGHKRSDQIVALGRWFAGRAGVAAVAIDGPYHGDRVPAVLPASVYQALIGEEGIEAVVNRMVVDWRLVVDTLTGRGSSTASGLAITACRWARALGCRWRLTWVGGCVVL